MDICRSIGVCWTHSINKATRKILKYVGRIGKRKSERINKELLLNYAEKIERWRFSSIQFYLKSADKERWAEKQEHTHTLNLTEIITSANSRIIDHKPDALPTARAKRSTSNK